VNRATASVVGCTAALVAVQPGAQASIQTQSVHNSSTMAPGELVPHWGGTPLVTSPSLALGGFDTRAGDRTLLDVAVFAKVTFSNIRLDVLNVSQLEPAPLVATGSSGFGATIGNPFVLMDPNKAWVSNTIEPEQLPSFGFIGEIEVSFEATTDLSAYVDHSMVLNSSSFDVYVSALLDARMLQSSDGSLVVVGATNDVADWDLTIDVWAEYTYSQVPAPATAMALAGFGLGATRRRR